MKKKTTEKRGRAMLDGRALIERASTQANEDRISPVHSNANLMDVVRAFEESIAVRKHNKWSDPEICAWLSELGYDINVGTLRTYRARLQIFGRPDTVGGEPAQRAPPSNPVPVIATPVSERGDPASKDAGAPQARTTRADQNRPMENTAIGKSRITKPSLSDLDGAI